VHREVARTDGRQSTISVDTPADDARQYREDTLHHDVGQMMAQPERIEAETAPHLGAARLLEGEHAGGAVHVEFPGWRGYSVVLLAAPAP
jgi:hypothetical protein